VTHVGLELGIGSETLRHWVNQVERTRFLLKHAPDDFDWQAIPADIRARYDFPRCDRAGPRATLGGSGLATVGLGAVACVLLLARRRNQRACGRGEAGDQTDQKSRSAGHRAAARVTTMSITIQGVP
jgi:hypothetical protein